MPRDDPDSRIPGAPDEAAAFAEAVRGARPLKGGVPRLAPASNAEPSAGRPPSPRARRLPRAPARTGINDAVESAQLTGTATGLVIEESGEEWTARADGVDRRILRKLRAGQLPVEAELDLHGLTRGPATQALGRFLDSARGAGLRCLLVIHGRGLHSGPDGPALRDAVRQFLVGGIEAGRVLASCTARREMGGSGALIVWLRR